ncbi:hypothetical protein D3C79_929500 [compost metagenome]
MLLRNACNESKPGGADAAGNGQVAFMVKLDFPYFGIVFQFEDGGRNDRTQLLLIGTGIDGSPVINDVSHSTRKGEQPGILVR